MGLKLQGTDVSRLGFLISVTMTAYLKQPARLELTAVYCSILGYITNILETAIQQNGLALDALNNKLYDGFQNPLHF